MYWENASDLYFNFFFWENRLKYGMPSGNFTVAMENGPFSWMIDLGNMVGFHSYSMLP
jgi:hypothetical protein